MMSPHNVVVTATFHPLEGKSGDLTAALTNLVPAIHQEPGCLLFALHTAEDGTITAIENWETEAALEAHGAGSPVAELNAAVAPLITTPATVTRMTPVPAGTAAQGTL